MKRSDSEDGLLRTYWVAVAVAAGGWMTLGIISAKSPATVSTSSSNPSAIAMLVFALALGGTVEALSAARKAGQLRAALGDIGDVARVRIVQLRRLLLMLGVICLAAAVTMAIVRWVWAPQALTALRLLYVVFLIAALNALAAARGLRRGWIDLTPGSYVFTTDDGRALSDKLNEQREELLRNEEVLRHQRTAIANIYQAIRDTDRQARSGLSSNLIWALVGFGLGILGNWIAEPLFAILIRPLDG